MKLPEPLLLVVEKRRAAPGLDEQPRLKPCAWRLLHGPSGALHLAVVVTEGTARVTSPLLSFDLLARTATTSSGRQYELERSPVAVPAIRGALYAVAFGVLGDFDDVSAKLWADIQQAAH